MVEGIRAGPCGGGYKHVGEGIRAGWESYKPVHGIVHFTFSLCPQGFFLDWCYLVLLRLVEMQSLDLMAGCVGAFLFCVIFSFNEALQQLGVFPLRKVWAHHL